MKSPGGSQTDLARVHLGAVFGLPLSESVVCFASRRNLLQSSLELRSLAIFPSSDIYKRVCLFIPCAECVISSVRDLLQSHWPEIIPLKRPDNLKITFRL